KMRGGCDLLGYEQSGGMHALGYIIYMDMLERAVKAIQEGRTPLADEPLALHSDINLRLPALIPDDYLPDIQLRLMMYKRIASSRDTSTLQELKVEMIDRFGLLPTSAQNLFAVQEIQIQAHQMGIHRLDASAEHGRIEFSPQTRVNPANLIRLIQSAPRCYKLEGSTRLRFNLAMATPQQRIEQVHELLNALSKP
ncbi:MAG: transcription-repair coupling factor, partial [Pseudomonadales bacterium]|nr:transcription-repair coupling factor [Pseudomonadales bacterium]